AAEIDRALEMAGHHHVVVAVYGHPPAFVGKGVAEAPAPQVVAGGIELGHEHVVAEAGGGEGAAAEVGGAGKGPGHDHVARAVDRPIEAELRGQIADALLPQGLAAGAAAAAVAAAAAALAVRIGAGRLRSADPLAAGDIASCALALAARVAAHA